MSRAKGTLAEKRAAEFLYAQGYEITEQNFYSRFGEIDIIAMKNSVLHFIEVKSGEDYESAIYNITPQKLSRIIKTAQVYMKKHHLDIDFIFDAVVVTPQEVSLVENITL